MLTSSSLVVTVGSQYFANTSAKNSIAFGPGLEPGQGIFGVEMPFLVLARDTTNMKRSSGGDKYVVNVKMDPAADTRGQYDLGSSTSRVVDLNNGLYEVYYSVPVLGSYLVEVLYEELGEGAALTPIKVRLTPYRDAKVANRDTRVWHGATETSP